MTLECVYTPGGGAGGGGGATVTSSRKTLLPHTLTQRTLLTLEVAAQQEIEVVGEEDAGRWRWKRRKGGWVSCRCPYPGNCPAVLKKKKERWILFSTWTCCQTQRRRQRPDLISR